MAFNYKDEDNPTSKFSEDSEVYWFDEDFIESWWFEKIDLITLKKYGTGFFDEACFFDEFMTKVQGYNLDNWNSVIFLFGKQNGANEKLFQYSGMSSKSKVIEFVFRKTYEVE